MPPSSNSFSPSPIRRQSGGTRETIPPARPTLSGGAGHFKYGCGPQPRPRRPASGVGERPRPLPDERPGAAREALGLTGRQRLRGPAPALPPSLHRHGGRPRPRRAHRGIAFPARLSRAHEMAQRFFCGTAPKNRSGARSAASSLRNGPCARPTARRPNRSSLRASASTSSARRRRASCGRNMPCLRAFSLPPQIPQASRNPRQPCGCDL